MGATTARLVALLSREVTWLALAANVVAWPIAFVATERWLDSFAYRIDPTPTPFVLGGGLVLLVALIAVGGQAYRASQKSPADAVRCE